jgi:hypothetical protein
LCGYVKTWRSRMCALTAGSLFLRVDVNVKKPITKQIIYDDDFKNMLSSYRMQAQNLQKSKSQIFAKPSSFVTMQLESEWRR